MNFHKEKRKKKNVIFQAFMQGIFIGATICMCFTIIFALLITIFDSLKKGFIIELNIKHNSMLFIILMLVCIVFLIFFCIRFLIIFGYKYRRAKSQKLINSVRFFFCKYYPEGNSYNALGEVLKIGKWSDKNEK